MNLCKPNDTLCCLQLIDQIIAPLHLLYALLDQAQASPALQVRGPAALHPVNCSLQSQCSCCKASGYLLTHSVWPCRLAWKDADVADIAKTACSLLDTLTCITPPHVRLHAPSRPGTSVAASQARAKAYETAIRGLKFALKHIMQQAEADAGSSKTGSVAVHQVLPSLLRALCVLLLPPLHPYGSGENSRIPSFPSANHDLSQEGTGAVKSCSMMKASNS